MKRLDCCFALILTSALGSSVAAHADTLPAGATRFNLFALDRPTIDVPKGTTLVVTDVVVSGGFFAACVFRDGDERNLQVTLSSNGSAQLSLQTGIVFHTQLRVDVGCGTLTLSGYWMDAT